MNDEYKSYLTVIIFTVLAHIFQTEKLPINVLFSILTLCQLVLSLQKRLQH